MSYRSPRGQAVVLSVLMFAGPSNYNALCMLQVMTTCNIVAYSSVVVLGSLHHWINVTKSLPGVAFQNKTRIDMFLGSILYPVAFALLLRRVLWTDVVGGFAVSAAAWFFWSSVTTRCFAYCFSRDRRIYTSSLRRGMNLGSLFAAVVMTTSNWNNKGDILTDMSWLIVVAVGFFGGLLPNLWLLSPSEALEGDAEAPAWQPPTVSRDVFTPRMGPLYIVCEVTIGFMAVRLQTMYTVRSRCFNLTVAAILQLIVSSWYSRDTENTVLEIKARTIRSWAFMAVTTIICYALSYGSLSMVSECMQLQSVCQWDIFEDLGHGRFNGSGTVAFCALSLCNVVISQYTEWILPASSPDDPTLHQTRLAVFWLVRAFGCVISWCIVVPEIPPWASLHVAFALTVIGLIGSWFALVFVHEAKSNIHLAETDSTTSNEEPSSEPSLVLHDWHSCK
ncbi:MAG: uncharacterized protein KVP18_002211 [Porospora cf. gigantea A]|uniref:uncharacterized protein n=1 Tax=Porospora cf. gigantea A TaxID=2853593 RepID=UPI00355A0544|nr:MAG: hypothetical protein KVP18_002211 [Porospora cf. gigantea A]